MRISPKASEKPEESRNSSPPKAMLFSVWMIQNCISYALCHSGRARLRAGTRSHKHGWFDVAPIRVILMRMARRQLSQLRGARAPFARRPRERITRSAHSRFFAGG